MLQHGNVADDPSYLSDIAAAIADCDTHEYQEILEEIDVSIINVIKYMATRKCNLLAKLTL